MRYGRHTYEYALARQLKTPHQKPRRQSLRSIVLGGLFFAGVIGVSVASDIVPPLVGCPIKGNISLNTGERIYHVPGQRYYDETHIELLKGERWFCSEAAAKAAGWRKSRV